jgi:hypothetical protein
VQRAHTDEDRKAALNSFKDRELFRIDMKHIVEADTTLPDFSAALTQLAEVIVDRSIKDCQANLNKLYGPPRLANKKPCPFTVLGLGKFGGGELGYACEDCHRTTLFSPVARVDHLHVIGMCSSCHNGTIARGQHAAHIPTTSECDACHNTTAWEP